MLQKLNDLPTGIDGVEARGKLSREDYEAVLRPLVEEAHRNERRIRFLYRFGPEFESFTPGAAWEDLRLGLKYLRLFERCAVVTDKDWIRNACQLMAPLLPCPLRAFRDADLSSATQWLGTPIQARNLKANLMPKTKTLVVDVKGPLSREDFDALSAEIDPWIEAHHSLEGIVVHAERFPGWENLGSFFRYLEFVGNHHKKIHRVALSADGTLPEVMPKLASHFVEAELKHFAFADLENAIVWASAGKATHEHAAASRKSA